MATEATALPVEQPAQKAPTKEELKRAAFEESQYMDFLQKMHKKTKLEAEISEFQYRRVMANNQLQGFQIQQQRANQGEVVGFDAVKGQEVPVEDLVKESSVENSVPQEPDVEPLNPESDAN